MNKILVPTCLAFIVFLLCSCSALENKSFAGAGTISALKIESTGSGSSGTPTPNVIMGGSAFAVATSPKDESRVVFVEARRHSFLDRIFGLGMSDSATIYIGSAGETAEETQKKINALRVNPDENEVQK